MKNPIKSVAKSSMNNTESSTPNNNALALDRTVLANERTYQAWLRTGLSFFAAGLGTSRFMKDEMSVTLVLVIACSLLLLSAAAFLQAAWRYQAMHLHISHLDIDTLPIWRVKAVSIFLALCALLSMVGLLMMAIDQ